MKLKKMLASICAVALVVTVGVGAALAAPADSSIPAISHRVEKCRRTELTEEQKEQMVARRASIEASQEKWAALTEEQKEQIYALREKAVDIDGQITDKYLELGVIDEEMASLMKERFSESTVRMRENGRMPMPGGRGAHGRGGFKGASPTEDTTDDTI